MERVRVTNNVPLRTHVERSVFRDEESACGDAKPPRHHRGGDTRCGSFKARLEETYPGGP